MSVVLNEKLDNVMSLVSEQRELLLRQEKEELQKKVTDLCDDFCDFQEIIAQRAKKKTVPCDLSVSLDQITKL